MKKTQVEKLAPSDELGEILREATQTVEDELKLEDAGWINLSATGGDVITSAARIVNLKLSRLYSAKDPLGKQAIRLWTDYTFGSGMTWSTENEKAQKALEAFWESKDNKGILSTRGQRKSSNKLLVDGEVFFAIFLGANGETKIRRINPLEITEIITDPEDAEKAMYYKRVWTDTQGKSHTSIYRSTTNIKNEATKDSMGVSIQKTEDALVYHIAYNTISQRGNPLLLPALDWIKQYRRFLSSRVAVMLALARFAWKTKVKGGQTAVDAIKVKTHEKEIAAGSQLIENLGSDTTPIKTDTGASSAYQDGRMIKLQIAAAVGIPEQYFGDISIGNLATAKTVELPMMKMFQSYQAIWNDAYQDIDEIILEHNGVEHYSGQGGGRVNNWYIDRDFPKIAPADIEQAAQAIVSILGVLPNLGDSPDIQQLAMITMGVNDPAEALKTLNKEAKANPEVALSRALREMREYIKESIKKE